MAVSIHLWCESTQQAKTRSSQPTFLFLFFGWGCGGGAFIFFPDMRGLEFGERWCEVGLFHLFHRPLLGRRRVGRVPCCDRRWERRVAAHGSHPVYLSFSIDGSSQCSWIHLKWLLVNWQQNILFYDLI